MSVLYTTNCIITHIFSVWNGKIDKNAKRIHPQYSNTDMRTKCQQWFSIKTNWEELKVNRSNPNAMTSTIIVSAFNTLCSWSLAVPCLDSMTFSPASSASVYSKFIIIGKNKYPVPVNWIAVQISMATANSHTMNTEFQLNKISYYSNNGIICTFPN